MTCIPALSPAAVDALSTMTIVAADMMLHADAVVPDAGLLPTFAEHVKLVVNPAPANVMVLLA